MTPHPRLKGVAQTAAQPTKLHAKRHNFAMKQILTTLALGLLTSLAAASPTSAPVRAEIDALLSRLQSSGCQFDRNGSWYKSSEAKDHILGKLEYIERWSSIQSTEQFIELAAAKSSSSGKPYHVKCGTEAAVESQQWLSKQLVLIRASAASQKSSPPAASSR